MLTQNSGQVAVGASIYVQVDIGNSGPVSDIGINKVRAQISIPTIATALPNISQDALPSGWIITANNGSAITICNGTDIIPVNAVRTVYIKIEGVSIGGPSTVSGVLSFGPGTGVCTGPGSLSGDITADNNSTSTVQVIAGSAPVMLHSFTGNVIKCFPNLKWTVTSEINFDRYEIERKEISGVWKLISTIRSRGSGNNSGELNYQFSDSNFRSEGLALYRLKIIDRDGSYQYSSILSLTRKCNNNNISIFPNPVNNTIFLNTPSGVKISNAIFCSLQGQIIQNIKFIQHPANIDVSRLKNGMYFLKLFITDGNIQTYKIMVSN